MIRAWSIPGSDGQPILGDTHLPDAPARGTLVICHGFKGYKDYGFFPRLADAAAHAGLVAHRFNFSHSGMTRRLDVFERPDLFERDTWNRQVYDLEQVAAFAATCPEALQLPIVVFGHSRGGVTALLAAARGLPVAGVVTAAAPDAACSLDDDQKAILRRDGRLLSPSARTGQDLYVGRAWLDQIEADPSAHDPRLAIARLRQPCLVIHGDADPTVPVRAARSLVAASDQRAELRLIPNANHTFNVVNPLPPDAKLPVEAQLLLEAVVSFALRCAESEG